MFTILCFFAIDASKGINYAEGGINMENHNGYVRDCSSLGADLVPNSEIQLRALPMMAKKAAPKASAGKAKKGGASSFYSSMV
eukprot:CAMPEP_0180136142 /NCGR_PEP_ID=MMETSP0986-20121125/11305_1 /TAXON_ID=697907 /ORGANISM="non described non described, Strain CCMP2293" /LENGTH=82 /DNA_ID=CAMNT_0022077085 /DNA_START=37 /DNA_END=285 /DNA_ORIENTATION=+